MMAAAGCAGQAGTDGTAATTSAALSPDQQAGHDTWFNSTFGGQHFFSQILPNAPFNLQLGFDTILTSDRNTRFEQYGVVNDPDCVQGDASSGYLDKCADDANAYNPTSTTSTARPPASSACASSSTAAYCRTRAAAVPRRRVVRRLPRRPGRAEPARRSEPSGVGEHQRHDG